MPLRLIKNPCYQCKYQGIRYGIELRYENNINNYYLEKKLEKLIHIEILMTRKEEAENRIKEYDKIYNEFIK
jgi:hypothetical protein|tara:strand:+ start:477 stop:692 length:216 start_codon:yes stop_codon:yes gene_type:complete